MKKATLELINDKFERDINDINYEIFKNKSEINKLAKKQRDLKDTRRGLCEILRALKDETK